MAANVLSAAANQAGAVPVSRTAGAAITAFSTLKFDSTEGQVIHTTAITEPVFGVALETVASGGQVSVFTVSGGLVKVRAGGTIASGDQLMPKASGDGVVDVLAGANAVGCGVAVSAGVSGETILMEFRPSVKSAVGT